MKKRVYLLTIFLACFIALLLSAVPVSAAEVVDSGNCGADGDNLTWTLDSDGVLTISGSGAMKDYNYYDGQPWKNKSIKTVRINSGVTSIGDDAFCDCDRLTSVEIPNSVTSIGRWAFDDCSNLTSIEIPDSVMSIGDDAFCDCDRLTSVEIPNGVTSIGGSAFFACDSLKSIKIPSSVTSIGEWAFRGCVSLTSIDVDTENSKYDSRNNCNAIIETESNTLILGCSTTLIPNGVTSIGNGAFGSCRGLTSIEIPNSVTSIGNGAFGYCRGLTSIEIPNSVTSIGDNAFDGCSSLTSIEIPDSVTHIGQQAFYACSSLTSIEIPNSVTSIEDDVFGRCSNLRSVKIPDSVTSIGEWAFYDCNSLTSIEIPNSVTSIGEHAFEGCDSLTSVKISNNVTSIEADTFGFCKSLTSVEIPNSVTCIGDNAFFWCSSLTSIEIPNSVTSIGASTFGFCSGLISVEIPNSVTSIGTHAFYACSSLTSIEIPNSVTSIGRRAFRHCDSLTSIEIPDSVTSIGSGVFSGCDSLTSIKVAAGNSKYDSRNNCNAIIKTESNTLISGCRTTLIPNSVTSIGESAFDGCSSLTSIEIPNSVTSIGRSAFSHCDSLTNVGISNSVTSIGECAFSSCDSLTSIEIPDSVTSIEKCTFEFCRGLTSIEIPNSVTSIREEAFSYCKSLTSIGIPNSVTSIGGSAFDHCESLTDVYYGGTEEQWAEIFIGDYNGYLKDATIHYSLEVDNGIAVFSTEKSLTVQTGESMRLGFGMISDGQLVGNWSKMAIVVSDPSVISLSEYEETERGYVIEVTGKKQGATNVTITDTESGASIIIVITVRDSYTKTYSYAIDNMVTFYPKNKWEKDIQTNIYNLNGLYVNNYQVSKADNYYIVTFDVYNSRYHIGAVDIYDADGNWLDCEEIRKYSDISSLWDTGEQTYYLISDAVNGKLLTYEQACGAEHTPIFIKIPDGGYFTISNNYLASPGTYMFNSCDILCEGVCTLSGAISDVKEDEVYVSFVDLVKDEITKDKTTREKFIGFFEETVDNVASELLKESTINEIDNMYAGISGLFENLLNSLDISWKHLFKSATGVGESAFTKFAGPAGVALKGCFAFTKGCNQLVQAVHLAASSDAPYVTVFSSISEGRIIQHGVIINTNGNTDKEAVLQVFRVSSSSTIEDVLGGDDEHLKKYELYNICFVKDDQLVQPNGKVTARIPIPDGMRGDTCNVYRQETDGSWTILNAQVDGNYLTFETDHFSLYGIVGEVDTLSITSLPSKTQYKVGDILDASGLVLSLGGKEITSGFLCEPTVIYQEGEQEITVQYGLASTKFSVSVEPSVEPETADSIKIKGKTADSISVAVENKEASRICLAIYSTDGKLLHVFEKAVPARAETAQFPLEGVDLPEEYSVKAFMLSENDWAPTAEASSL